MYGFVEKFLADALNLPYTEFKADGQIVAVLDIDNFLKVKEILLKIWFEDNDDDLLKPHIINSDVVGMKVLFHKYWLSESILYALTDGPTKESDRFLYFSRLENPKFDYNNFINRFKIIESITTEDIIVGGIDFGATTEDVVVEDAVVENTSHPIFEDDVVIEEVVNEPTQEELFIKFFDNNIYNIHSYHSPKNNKIIKIQDDRFLIFSDEILELADIINKNLFIISELTLNFIKKKIKNDFKLSDISKHTIIVFLDPSKSSDFIKPLISNNIMTTCFGENLLNLYCLNANIDSSLISEEMDHLNNSPYQSIYSKYDEVFKDSYTNVVWALKDRCFIQFTYEVIKQSNKLISKCIKELGKRFDRKLSINEMMDIDKKYHDEIEEYGKDKYIEFAISSAKSMIDEFKLQFQEEKKSYEEYMSKTMEHGKLMQRLAEQIDSYDEESMSLKQKEKALDDYIETIKIPNVLSINIIDNTIHVYTKNIYAQDERTEKWHDIGTFHIRIGMMSNDYNISNTVKIMNTKHQIRGLNEDMQAPHIFHDGTICHGSLATGMIEAYKRRNLFELVYQIILFLKTANVDDSAGKYINKWPEVPEDVAKGKVSIDKYYNQPSEDELKFDKMLMGALL